MAMLVMAGCRWWHVLMLVPAGAFVVWHSIFKDPTSFRYRRMMAFMNPETLLLAGPQGGNVAFAGTGGQIMLVFNH